MQSVRKIGLIIGLLVFIIGASNLYDITFPLMFAGVIIFLISLEKVHKEGIEYLRETHIELYYKDIPIKLGAPDFYLSKESPPTIIEIKLGASISNSNRQQLKMYLVSIKRNPKSILKNVKNGILINFLKEDPTTYESEPSQKKKELFKVEIEKFTLDKNNNLKLLEKLSLGDIK